MIPKVIHCCWLSGEPKPKLSEKCRESWKKFAPGWEIREWNLSNLSILSNLSNLSNFCLAAVAARKWAFAADWVRMAVLKECGLSIWVSEMTVPFCSMSSRFTRSQLCICCA